MVRGGRAEAPVLRSDISFRLHQKTDNVKVTFGSRLMQWSVLTEKKQKNELAYTEFRCHKNKNNNKGRQSPVVLRVHISVAPQQKTGNFKLAFGSRTMQWSVLPEGKQKNQLAQTELRFIKTNNNKGRQLLAVLRLYISVAQQQKTGNFKAAIGSRPMQ